ncbi:hypothetical protein EV182_003885, partial [Spiromyces aspiralis]
MAAESPDSNSPPTRDQRKVCHKARDAYFKCLDEAGIDNPEDAKGTCFELRQKLYEDCPKTWADYFLQLRILTKQREKSALLSTPISSSTK